MDARDIEGPTVDAEAGNQVVEVLEISDDNGEAESVDPALTASAFAEPRQTPEDYDAFAPEPRSSPRGDDHLHLSMTSMLFQQILLSDRIILW